jgi:hypothetical protein
MITVPRTCSHWPRLIGPGQEAVFILNWPDGPVGLRENLGFDGRAIRALAVALDQAVATLCEGWEAFHGNY